MPTLPPRLTAFLTRVLSEYTLALDNEHVLHTELDCYREPAEHSRRLGQPLPLRRTPTSEVIARGLGAYVCSDCAGPEERAVLEKCVDAIGHYRKHSVFETRSRAHPRSNLMWGWWMHTPNTTPRCCPSEHDPSDQDAYERDLTRAEARFHQRMHEELLHPVPRDPTLVATHVLQLNALHESDEFACNLGWAQVHAGASGVVFLLVEADVASQAHQRYGMATFRPHHVTPSSWLLLAQLLSSSSALPRIIDADADLEPVYRQLAAQLPGLIEVALAATEPTTLTHTLALPA